MFRQVPALREHRQAAAFVAARRTGAPWSKRVCRVRAADSVSDSVSDTRCAAVTRAVIEFVANRGAARSGVETVVCGMTLSLLRPRARINRSAGVQRV